MKGIFHTGVTVSNLERSIEFYRDVLGLELVIGPTGMSSGEELSRGVGVPGTSLRMAVFKVGEGSLELLQYYTPKSAVEKAMPLNTIGAEHVAFQVDNIEEKMRELEAKGVKFLSQPNLGKDEIEGWKWVYFRDPDGISAELVEYHPPK